MIVERRTILAGENDYTTGTFRQITGPHAQSPVFVANGDSDPVILPHYYYLLAA